MVEENFEIWLSETPQNGLILLLSFNSSILQDTIERAFAPMYADARKLIYANVHQERH